MRARRSPGILVAILLAILALTLTGCSAPTLTPPSLSSDTPVVFTFYGDGGDGGLEALNASNGQPMWKTHVGNMYTFPSLANGVVYGVADHNSYTANGIADPHSFTPRSVIAVRASDGKILWQVSEPQIDQSEWNAYVVADLSIVALFAHGGIYGLDPSTGKQRWHIAGAGYAHLMRHGIIYATMSTTRSPGAPPDATAYPGLSPTPTPQPGCFCLVAVRASDGARLWETPFDSNFMPLVVVGNDHALYAGTGSGTVLGWDTHTGQRLASDSPYAIGDHQVAGTVDGSPVAASDKVVLLATFKSGTRYMQAFSAMDGHMLWEVPNPGFSTSIIGNVRFVGDFIYIMDPEGAITALRVRDGSLAWRTHYQDYLPWSFSMSGDTIFAVLRLVSPKIPCSPDCGVSVVALDATNGSSSWRRDMERIGFFPSPAQ